MAYYGEAAWSAPVRQASWEQQQQPPPSRPGASSAPVHEEAFAFHSQIDEVDRAIDNLVKSGKFPFGMSGRRDSMPPVNGPRGYAEYDPRMGGGSRHHSVSEFDGMRSVSNVQGFYQNQRFGPRGDTDQMMQTKRRMAAQRERELRNYHQEQQYNRSVLADIPSTQQGAPKSDRSLSPNTMSEEDRRELIARQHRALYGDNASLYSTEGSNSRPISQDARVSTTMGGRGQSPLAFDPFSMQSGGAGDSSAVQMPPRDRAPGSGKEADASGANRSRANSNSSPASNPTTSFNLFENAQQSSRTSNSSPTSGSPPRQGSKPTATSGAGVAPIGTRPTAQTAVPNQQMNKRSTTPLPSPLSYGFTASEQNNAAANDRSTSAASNPQSGMADKGVGLGWGGSSGVWGSNNKLGVQASVWG